MNFWDQNWILLRIVRTVFPNILILLWELFFKSENLLFVIVSPNNVILQALKKSLWCKKQPKQNNVFILCKLMQFWLRLDIHIYSCAMLLSATVVKIFSIVQFIYSFCWKLWWVVPSVSGSHDCTQDWQAIILSITDDIILLTFLCYFAGKEHNTFSYCPWTQDWCKHDNSGFNNTEESWHKLEDAKKVVALIASEYMGVSLEKTFIWDELYLKTLRVTETHDRI